MRIASCLPVLVVAVLLALAPGLASASELEVRSGVVTMVQPVAGDTARAEPKLSRSTRRQLGGMLGRAAGQALGGGHAYEIGRAAGSVGSDLADGEGNPQAGGGGGYLLLVRFDDESEAAFTRGAVQVGGLRAGSRVKVIGSGDGATLLAE